VFAGGGRAAHYIRSPLKRADLVAAEQPLSPALSGLIDVTMQLAGMPALGASAYLLAAVFTREGDMLRIADWLARAQTQHLRDAGRPLDSVQVAAGEFVRALCGARPTLEVQARLMASHAEAQDTAYAVDLLLWDYPPSILPVSIFGPDVKQALAVMIARGAFTFQDAEDSGADYTARAFRHNELVRAAVSPATVLLAVFGYSLSRAAAARRAQLRAFHAALVAVDTGRWGARNARQLRSATALFGDADGWTSGAFIALLRAQLAENAASLHECYSRLTGAPGVPLLTSGDGARGSSPAPRR